jgi:hypothetical protein
MYFNIEVVHKVEIINLENFKVDSPRPATSKIIAYFKAPAHRWVGLKTGGLLHAFSQLCNFRVGP